MANNFDFKKAEEKILKFWEKEKVYKFDTKSKKEIYSIDTPPPTVSGKMHIGHAFSYSQQDFIARFRRMNGNVFYPFGTDDNGLATERLVEKLNPGNLDTQNIVYLLLGDRVQNLVDKGINYYHLGHESFSKQKSGSSSNKAAKTPKLWIKKTLIEDQGKSGEVLNGFMDHLSSNQKITGHPIQLDINGQGWFKKAAN